MKKTHIIAIIGVAICIGLLMVTLVDSSTYANFSEAFEMKGKEFHVVGKHNKDKPSIYEPEIDPNVFEFYMIDNNGEERKVILHKSKPQDFDVSEQIVLIGEAQGELFIAKDILMKCPSKYNNTQDQMLSQH